MTIVVFFYSFASLLFLLYLDHHHITKRKATEILYINNLNYKNHFDKDPERIIFTIMDTIH